ncbi:hypothetical protein [Kitasatospora viridis]|uniref:Uncharacterized protein n=1 Tax=Kitasatospora viridis TaxID=281105 RepID=A0A561UIK8_9ACTN|nr:hypothetical protein [Kitasatospora viridis]TWF99180.1 hypothetical protein FHX73_113021 [Kitasatospora viridis]
MPLPAAPHLPLAAWCVLLVVTTAVYLVSNLPLMATTWQRIRICVAGALMWLSDPAFAYKYRSSMAEMLPATVIFTLGFTLALLACRRSMRLAAHYEAKTGRRPDKDTIPRGPLYWATAIIVLGALLGVWFMPELTPRHHH